MTYGAAQGAGVQEKIYHCRGCSSDFALSIPNDIEWEERHDAIFCTRCGKEGVDEI